MFLGIDLGTSGVKAVVVDEAGRLIEQSSASLSVQTPHRDWSEQDPDEWWRAADSAVMQLDPAIRAQIKGIGLSGQMHGATVLDGTDRPLRPAILWNDGRSHSECLQLEDLEPESRAITGNLAMPGFTAPKLLWLRNHEPEVFDAIRTVLLPKDYLRLHMTGEKASDMSDSAGTLWLDVSARDWSDRMLAACGITRDHMPALLEGPDVSGTLRDEIATQWGVGRIPVVAGGGDNAAGAAGIGIIADGDALLSLGTSGVIFVATDTVRANPQRAIHTFCHCLPGNWHQMAVHLSAASCIDWAARQLGLPGPAPVYEIAEQAGAAYGPELFLPFLSGERTPHNDPHVRACFFGLDVETQPGRLAAAVLEGVAFALADGMDALRAAGTQVETLHVIGGGSRSRHWGIVIAAALGTRLVYIDGGEVGPAMGAAKLAMMGMTGLAAAEACTRPAVIDAIDPDQSLADRLAPKRERFRQAYTAIKNL